MTQKIRWGILSTANIGRKRVIPAIQKSNNGEVYAVASRNEASAREFADELGIPVAHGSYEALIADENVDAIYNPLPNSMHAEWSIKAAEAGKPTLCEKPLASDEAEAQTMVDAFAERGVLFAEAFMYRFHPQTITVKRMVDEGAIGDLHVIKAAFSFSISDENNIRLSKELAGGSLMDVGCYCVNVIRHMTGEEPDDVHAFGEIGEHTGVEERLTGILKFPSGVLAHFDSSLRTQHRHTYEIRGTKGRIVVDEGFTMPADRETVVHYWQDAGLGQDIYHKITIPAANSYTLMAQDFAAALLDNRPPLYAPQDGVDNMRVIDRLLASMS